MEDAGWIKTHRSIIEWEWYTDTNVMRLWLHLLLRCNYVQKRWHGKIINPGELIVGVEDFGAEVGLTRQQTRTAFFKLKSTNEITITPHSKFSLIKINNWNKYQQINQQDNQQVTNNQPTSNQQVTTTKERKKERRKETTTAAEKILEILGLGNREQLVAPVEELISSYGEDHVKMVAIKLADSKVGNPDARWLRFVNWCGSEFSKEEKKPRGITVV